MQGVRRVVTKVSWWLYGQVGGRGAVVAALDRHEMEINECVQAVPTIR